MYDSSAAAPATLFKGMFTHQATLEGPSLLDEIANARLRFLILSHGRRDFPTTRGLLVVGHEIPVDARKRLWSMVSPRL